MSFWDTLKPSTRTARASAVDLSADGRLLSVTWDDGSSSALSARTLRQYCPCASCVEEWTGKRTYDVESIKPDMKVNSVGQTGNYALAFVFADNHSTGIYTWELLRELAQAHPASGSK